MRSLRLAAAAILAGCVVTAVLAGAALAAPANLAAGFPATRIKLDSPSPAVNMPGPITLTATIVDWRGAPLGNVPVVFTNVTDPQKPSQLGKGTTDKGGHATFTYSNGKEPRIDVVQATFTDGLEVHKSNRSFVAWQSGTPATAIASPAAITVTPGCFQPATAVTLASDTFKPGSPRATPKPSTRATPTPAPPAVTYTINVNGVNFNPYSAVLVSFDAGPGR